MSTISSGQDHLGRNTSAAASSAKNWVGQLARQSIRLIAAFIVRCAERRLHRLAERHLHSMPDRMLKDIGISRSQITCSVRSGRKNSG